MTGKKENEKPIHVESVHLGVTTYHASELDERKKNDWQESKKIVKKLFPREVGI